MSTKLYWSICILALIIVFASCKKSEDAPAEPEKFNTYADKLEGTWVWAVYEEGYTPQGSPRERKPDTTLPITRLGGDSIFWNGYKFHYTDTLEFRNFHQHSPVDLSKYRCFQAYNYEHDYLYLRYSFSDDSVYAIEYSGGVVYGSWVEYYTCVKR